MNLANLSVAKKLIAAFSILGLVILISGGIAILQTTRIEDAAAKLSHHLGQPVEPQFVISQVHGAKRVIIWERCSAEYGPPRDVKDDATVDSMVCPMSSWLDERLIWV